MTGGDVEKQVSPKSSRGIGRGRYEGHEAERGDVASALFSVEVEAGIDEWRNGGRSRRPGTASTARRTTETSGVDVGRERE